MTIDEFENIALSEFGELPDEVKKNLNLDLAILPQAKMDKDGLTYTLGEYYTDPMMGRGIRLYYGSFMATMGHLPPEMLNKEIIRTVRHEIRHHVEISAGVDYLGKEDRMKMAKIRRRFGKAPDDKTIERAFIARFLGAAAVLVITLALIYFLLLRFLK